MTRHKRSHMVQQVELAALKKLGEGLVEKLITQQGRACDRELDEKFIPYHDFAEWYADMKHMFVMPFSRVELLAVRVLQLYVAKQLHRLFEEQAGVQDIDSVHSNIRQAIEADSERLLGLLKMHWPAEWADLEKRNGAGQHAMSALHF